MGDLFNNIRHMSFNSIRASHAEIYIKIGYSYILKPNYQLYDTELVDKNIFNWRK